MNGVIGMLDLLLDTEITQQQREYVSMCRSSAEAMLRLLNDILDVSKIESGRFDLDRYDFSLRQTLKASLTPLLQELRKKSLGFQCTVPAVVPDLLVGDAGRLSQIMTNLANNAIKFTGSGEISISLTGEDQGEDSVELHVAVRDTGIGIPANRLKAIFESFRQVDSSTTRKYGGTGLGLGIAKSLAELMGGRIWVESSIGKGSTFHVTVRVGLQQVAATAPDEQPPVEWVTWSVGSEVGNFDKQPGVDVPRADALTDLPDMLECIHKLNNAVALRNDVLIEEYAQKLKDRAAAAQRGKLSDDAFRIQLAARNGDIPRAAALFARLGAEWAEQSRCGATAAVMLSSVKK